MIKDPVTRSAEVSVAAGAKLTRHQRWALVKTRTIQILGGLIMEKDDEGAYVISIGRVSWWVAFLPAIGIWIASGGHLNAGEAIRDISPNHFNILVVLAGYNFGKKVTDTAKLIFGKKGNQAPVQPITPIPPINNGNQEGNDPKPPTGRWD